MQVSKGPGRYTISITNGYTTPLGVFTPTYGTIDRRIKMTFKLPRQTLRLRTFKMIVTNDNAAMKYRDARIELPFISFNHMVDNTPHQTSFSFPLSGRQTFENALEKPLYMNADAELEFIITVKDGEGVVIPDIYCLYLDFETELGSVA